MQITTEDGRRMTSRSGALAQFKDRLVASLGIEKMRLVSPGRADVLILSELATTLVEHGGADDGSIPDSLTIRTCVAEGISASHPDLDPILATLGRTGGLNRWTYQEKGGELSLEATLLIADPDNDSLLRLAEFLLKSQISEARAKLFAGLHDSLGARPGLLCNTDSEFLWTSKDYTIPCFIEDAVNPFRERADLWDSLWDRSKRLLPIPDYAPYQGPGWLGLPAEGGWVVQLPWTSIAKDYGVIEIRPDHLLNFSDGETVRGCPELRGISVAAR